jgi:hypothetical protein
MIAPNDTQKNDCHRTGICHAEVFEAAGVVASYRSFPLR